MWKFLELSSLKKDSENIMLSKSSKSRLAAMALMALGVTTFMGTSAALAFDHEDEDVTIHGEVVPCSATTTTLSSADHPYMGEIALGKSKTENLTFTMAQGIKNAACDKKSGTVTAEMNPSGYFGSAAEASNPVTVTVGAVGDVDASGVGLIPVTATVPSAAKTGEFGAVVTLTLVDDA
jgi:hypothetical protein